MTRNLQAAVQTAPYRNIRNIATHDQIQYESEVRTAMLGGRKIRVEHLTPILTPKEREERKREIENCLFDVFVKYKGNQK